MSVTKLDNGRYKARYRDAANKEHAHTFDKKSDADRWERNQRGSVDRGDWIDPKGPRILFRTYAEDWRKIQHHRPSTQDTVEQMLRLHVYPTFGDRRIGSVKPSEVKAWLAKLVLAQSSKRLVYSYLASIFKAAVQDRVVAASPCQVKWKTEKTLLEPLTLADIEWMTKNIGRYRNLVLLAAGSGVRMSEALGLTSDRVDFLRREIKIDRQLSMRFKAGEVFIPPKSSAGHRTIPVAEGVINVLAEEIATHGLGRDDLIFTTAAHEPINRTVVASAWIRARDRQPSFPQWASFHDLRHFYASCLIGKGCNVKEVQRVLGHESAVMTLDVYGHWWPTDNEHIRSAVQDTLWPVVVEEKSALILPLGENHAVSARSLTPGRG